MDPFIFCPISSTKMEQKSSTELQFTLICENCKRNKKALESEGFIFTIKGNSRDYKVCSTCAYWISKEGSDYYGIIGEWRVSTATIAKVAEASDSFQKMRGVIELVGRLDDFRDNNFAFGELTAEQLEALTQSYALCKEFIQDTTEHLLL